MPHVLLVTAAELPLYGMAEEFTQKFGANVVAVVLQSATDDMLGRMKPAVTPPLTAWGADLRMHTAHLAIYWLKSNKGLAPIQAAVGDENVVRLAQAAQDWADQVGDGEIEPQDLVDSSEADTTEGISQPVSNDLRGW